MKAILSDVCELSACNSLRKTNSRGGRYRYCSLHYRRIKQYGDAFENLPAKTGVRNDTKYIQHYAPKHPLASPTSGIVRTHRAVLYDVIGPGQHNCHWCSALVNWDVRCGKNRGPQPDALEVDHLNGDKSDNRPENLVASCGVCNRQRAGTWQDRPMASYIAEFETGI